MLMQEFDTYSKQHEYIILINSQTSLSSIIYDDSGKNGRLLRIEKFKLKMNLLKENYPLALLPCVKYADSHRKPFNVFTYPILFLLLTRKFGFQTDFCMFLNSSTLKIAKM